MGMKGYLVPFLAAFVVCAVAFVLLDWAIMNAQGLTLVFER